MFYDITKRLLDIIGASVAVILFSPIMIATAIYIKIVSPEGPILADMKKRVGKSGKEFKMFKFRSMVPNGHAVLESNPELYKKYVENNYKLDAHEDPRLIKGAAFIRKTSIDEMPQFFNVLLGQMSIVGPRAYFQYELDEQVQRYPQTKNDITRALTTKPGITGPWQVGGRSKIGFVDRIRIDGDYASKRSILYDLVIILKTPYAVLSQKGSV